MLHFFPWSAESLVTNFGFRKCVITLPDDISIKTTIKLPAGAFVVNQKYLFSFQNNPNPNAGAWHKSQRPHVSRRNVVQLEPGGSTRHVRSSCVSSPHQSSWKLQKCTLLDSCLPQSNAHLLYPRPLAATKNNLAQKHTAQQWHRESELGWFGNSCFQSWNNGHGVWLNAITQITSITSAKSWMICQESGTKLSSYWGGKMEIFVKACKNYSSPRTSATMSNGSYKLL